MPAHDIYHDAVKHALVKDGWTITHDPYTISYGERDVFVDFGAERLLAAEKGKERIAIEVKSFIGASEIRDLEAAVGQYVFYRSLLVRYDPNRKLLLAVPETVLNTTFNEPIARPVLEDYEIAVFAFDPRREVIVKWKT